MEFKNMMLGSFLFDGKISKYVKEYQRMYVQKEK